MTNVVYDADHRFGGAEALQLLRGLPLLELGRMAFDAKRRRFGDSVTYVRNRHVNPTNLCVYHCHFCDFAAKKGDAHAYQLSEDDILAQFEDPDIREAHIVGGLWPHWGFDRSIELVRRLRAQRPGLCIKAFTAVEVAYFARMEKMTYEDVLRAMLEAGVDMMPGGGAEVLSDRIHDALFAQKIGAAEWLEIHEKAHRLGLPSNCTLLFGHIETDEEIVDHLITLRDLQERAPGFHSFIPLVYQPGATLVVDRSVPAPRALRIVALARLVLDNIPHVKAYWPSLQIETAVAALNFGADDLDGTVGRERIMQLAGSGSPEHASVELLEKMIRQAGQTPRERDGTFNFVFSEAEPAGVGG